MRVTHCFRIGAVAAAVWLLASLALAADAPVADAAMNGDVETVRALLAGGADVNAAQGDGMTALHWAAFQDFLLYTSTSPRARQKCGMAGSA